MPQIEKKLTEEQMISLVQFIYGLVKDGNRIIYLDKDESYIETSTHRCKFAMSYFGGGKDIFRFYVRNKLSNKEIFVNKNDVEKIQSVSNLVNYIQKEVASVITKVNTPSFFSNNEVEDVIGDNSLLGMRSKKVDHLIDNIEEKKKKRKWYL